MYNVGKMQPEQRAMFQGVGRQPIPFEVLNFTKKQELFDYITANDYESPTVAGVCFGIMVEDLGNNRGFNLEILLNDQNADGRSRGLPSQLILPFDNYISKPDITSFELYTQRGFAKVHNWLANIVLRHQFSQEKDGRLPTISNVLIPMQGQDYVEDDFSRILVLLSFFIFLIYIVPLYRITYRIVNEKETRARESMKMMGLTDTSYWLSWTAYFGIIVTIISTIITVLLSGLIKSSGSLMFVVIWLYGMSLFGYALIM